MEKTFCLDDALVKEIISLLPSADLKAEIQKRNHRFTDEELLQIAYQYAPSFDERIALLERFLQSGSVYLSSYAKKYIDYEKDNLKRFTDESSDFVYELTIKETPESWQEKYICATYDDALACIDRYYWEYEDVGARETSQTRYRIKKRKVYRKELKFEEDNYSECLLGPGKKLIKISDNKEKCALTIECAKCKEICPVRYIDIEYPCFAENYSLIKYHDYDDKEYFGVNIFWNNNSSTLETAYYVIPLDSASIREHLFDETFNYHMHIELPSAELATIEELDEKTRNNYYDFVAYLKHQEIV